MLRWCSEKSYAVCLFASVAATAGMLGLPAFGAPQAWVASYGQDTHDCTNAAPCRTLSRALRQTDVDGQVVVLDSATYDPIVISQSVSILAPSGVQADIPSAVGQNGVHVNGPGVHVTLRGLKLSGRGGRHGVFFQQGAQLLVEDCAIDNMAGSGILIEAASGSVSIRNTIARDNRGSGVHIVGPVSALLDKVHAEGNGTTGMTVSNEARVVVHGSKFLRNAVWGFAVTGSAATPTHVALIQSLVSTNLGDGIHVDASEASGGINLHIAHSTVSKNGENGVYVTTPIGGRAYVVVTDSLVHDNKEVDLHQSRAALLESRGVRNLDGLAPSVFGNIGTVSF